ncbi:hypothetical protein ACFL6U_12290, partial [Planctomycetota bacterium]
VTAITVVGTINFRFLAMRQAVQAEAYSSGARAGQVVLESWRASGALTSFDPLASLGSDSIDFSISAAKTGPTATTGLSEIGNYHIQIDGFNYYTTLAYQPATTTSPALMAVGIGWRFDNRREALESGSPVIWLSSYL